MARRAIGTYNTLHANRSFKEQTVYAEFGRRLQSLMLKRGWNQTEMARRATACLPKADKGQVQGHTIGRDRISSYIRGKYLPRPEGLAALAKALKCEMEDLLPPELGVPTALEEGPLMEFKELDGQRGAIHLNRVVSKKTALAIMTLLEKEDSL